jgi:hypothetical protein
MRKGRTSKGSAGSAEEDDAELAFCSSLDQVEGGADRVLEGRRLAPVAQHRRQATHGDHRVRRPAPRANRSLRHGIPSQALYFADQVIIQSPNFGARLQMHVKAVDGPPLVVQRVPRNRPCPCDSGRRYKHCHGKGAQA